MVSLGGQRVTGNNLIGLEFITEAPCAHLACLSEITVGCAQSLALPSVQKCNKGRQKLNRSLTFIPNQFRSSQSTTHAPAVRLSSGLDNSISICVGQSEEIRTAKHNYCKPRDEFRRNRNAGIICSTSQMLISLEDLYVRRS